MLIEIGVTNEHIYLFIFIHKYYNCLITAIFTKYNLCSCNLKLML